MLKIWDKMTSLEVMDRCNAIKSILTDSDPVQYRRGYFEPYMMELSTKIAKND